MPRLIFTSRYLSQAPVAQLSNLVAYMGTRPGVEFFHTDSMELPATEKQQALIRQLQSEFPDMAELAEYGDYRQQPNRENTSELITAVTEQYADQIVGREQFVRYMGMRPRAERVGAHGLFTQDGGQRPLNVIVDEVANHQGNVWSHVLSLRREDAARLGYDNQAAYKSLLHNHLSLLAQAHKISPDHLRWVAAFHNESHHPHLHLLVYSADPAEGYLTKQGIERMRGGFARDIFQDTLKHLYNAQTDARNTLREQAKALVEDLTARIEAGSCVDERLTEQLMGLHEQLQALSGRPYYQYLPPEAKQAVDAVVDRLAENEQIAALYKLWREQRSAVLQTYTDQEPESLPLSQCKEFRPIQNAVIQAAISLSAQTPTEESDTDDALPDEPEAFDFLSDEEPMDEWLEEPEQLPDEGSLKFSWSKDYKEAQRLWYKAGATDDDLKQAYTLMLAEARKGNTLAVHDMGKMRLDGIGCEEDEEQAQQWSRLALQGFMEAEAAEKKRDYIQYRIGKMHAFGYGTELDHAAAAGWYQKAVDAGNPFAAYALGGLYLRGQGVDRDESTAFDLYTMAAEDAKRPNAYAMYELGGMYKNGRGTKRDEVKSKQWYARAYPLFVDLEKDGGEDKLKYRLGKMNLSGMGTPVNYETARAYLEKAAALKNVNAYYGMGMLYLKKEYAGRDPRLAVEWLIRAAEADHEFALYTLGKVFLKGEDAPKDMSKALAYLEASAGQGNQFAQYTLGKVFLKGEDTPKDVAKALAYLEASAGQGNQFAQYTLGKVFLKGEDAPKDVTKALAYLGQSAGQGNQFAQYTLGKLFLKGLDAPKNIQKALVYLEQSAGQGNQFAQYTLGKLYLYGGEVPRDKERALYWLDRAAAQGNAYAVRLLENALHPPVSPAMAAFSLLQGMARLLDNQMEEQWLASLHTDSKLLAEIAEKKARLGIQTGQKRRQVRL